MQGQIEVQLNPDTPPTGSDLAVVNAARRSFNTRSEWSNPYWVEFDGGTLKDKDKRLIEFLARGMTAKDFESFVDEVERLGYNSFDPRSSGDEWFERDSLVEKLWEWRTTPIHDTPFNHCFISFEVKAPIFVRAQLVKHEYLILSEFSRRYITDDIEFYEPDYWRKAAPNKKQGSLEEPVESILFKGVTEVWEGEPSEFYYNLCDSAKATFTSMVESGVAPEQARMVLPQSTMTEWTWSGTLGAFAKMCQLRLHPEAQYEARLVAQQVYNYLKEYYPVSAKALVEGPDV